MRKQRKTKKFIFYFPSAGDVQPLLGKQGFSKSSSCSGRQKSWKLMSLTSSCFLLAFVAKQMSYSMEHPLGQFWVSCPGYVPSQDLAYP